MQEDLREWSRTLEGLPSATLVDIILLLVSVLSAAEGSTGRVRYALNQVRRVAIQHHARSPSNLRDVTPVQALRAVRPTPPRSEVASPVAPVLRSLLAAKARAEGKAKANFGVCWQRLGGWTFCDAAAWHCGQLPSPYVAEEISACRRDRSRGCSGTGTRRSRSGPAVGKQTSPGLALPVTAVAASSVLILILI